ncbi:radical SAM protein [Clostridium sp.]|uniref:radical SAM/SPASM domain-containing protein n=1 Tax=Clostridium sp. TaxID=1506 RepID=UPI0025BBC208|nr:radical SAM protein [Clostridium sp.]
MRDFYKSPCFIDITTTKRCNLRCDYCSVSAGNCYEDELNLEEFKKLFKEVHDLNIHRISLSGGEPFTRSDFFDILNEATKYDYATIINSNGTLITEEIAKKLTRYNFNRICITLDGDRPEIHEYFRGKGSFEKTINGIKNLQKYNLPVSTLFTLNKINVNNLIDCIKFNEKLGIEYMSVMVLCPTGRATSGNLLVDKNTWYEVFNKLTDMKKNEEIKLNFKIVPPNESDVFWLYYFPLKYYDKLDLLYLWEQEENNNYNREISCKAGISSCYIDANGDVYGCELMSGINSLLAGNIKKQSLKDIWDNSSVFSKLRNMKFENLRGKCKECPHTWCGGGCRSTAFNLGGSLCSSDESCFYESN